VKSKKNKKGLFTPEDKECYNTKKNQKKSIKNKKEEDKKMAQLLERLKTYEIPPHIAEQLGLGKDWKNSVSQELLQHILTSLDKYQNVMKKLSDK
jgi:hypothetical protein